MPKKNTVAKNETVNDNNAVNISGVVMRAKQLEKVCRFTLDVQSTTPKGSTAHSYVPCVWFNADSEDTVTDGERIGVNGSLRSGSYENKEGKKVYTLDLVVENVIFS